MNSASVHANEVSVSMGMPDEFMRAYCHLKNSIILLPYCTETLGSLVALSPDEGKQCLHKCMCEQSKKVH